MNFTQQYLKQLHSLYTSALKKEDQEFVPINTVLCMWVEKGSINNKEFLISTKGSDRSSTLLHQKTSSKVESFNIPIEDVLRLYPNNCKPMKTVRI